MNNLNNNNNENVNNLNHESPEYDVMVHWVATLE